jgi:hypothetical protein
VKDFGEPAAVAVKHMNPCGVGTGASPYEAFLKAFESDSGSYSRQKRKRLSYETTEKDLYLV